ncbi:MAG: DUF3108 domain-containing protein [Candidatus Omnitrophica bacterium]|nr:DUF3108 domain-containing protein [Candidatus Omnitrophota bacterium]MCG2703129.1 DUF3108 domain-containing protein [Candidatus Omnitrophota bacterium]
MYIRIKRNRRARLLFLLLFMLAFFYAWHLPQNNLPLRESYLEDKTVKGKERKEVSSRIGEQIVFDVMLGKVRIGTARYHYVREAKVDGREAYLITFETKAVKFRDQETIYCDRATFLPVLVERKVTQLLKPENIREVYDQRNYTLTITKKRFTEETQVIKKDGPIHNSILLPFFVRNNSDLKAGWSVEVNLPQKNFKITLTAVEDVDVPAGIFQAYYFESEPSQIKIWISTDERRIPLKLEGTGGIGYRLVMREYIAPNKNAADGK